MAHAYLLTRGIKHEVDQFITELQGKYLPYRWRNLEKGKTDKEVQAATMQLSVRPIQFWEICFPEECRDIVLSTILSRAEGKTNQLKHRPFVWAMRKALGVKPIPKYDNTRGMPLRCQGIELVGVGYKRDYWVDIDGKHLTPEEYDKLTDEQKKKCFEAI